MATIASLVEKINGGNNPFFKEIYGTDEAILKSQAERYALWMNNFKALYGSDDVTCFSSPGRTEVGGNHTDHQFGRVLAGAVNLDNIAVAAANGTDIVKIKSEGFPAFEVNLAVLEISETGVTHSNLV
ncbi:MAG: galactokinase family protein [Bacteroidales bacterium]|jgi:galactokinase|nr:galactokinase family protein [Bacteroidales bacterium]